MSKTAPSRAISAFAPTTPPGPLAAARSGGIRALLADPAIAARLAAKGLTTAAAIASARPSDVTVALADPSGPASTAPIQAAAAAEVQFLDQMALGLAPGWKTDPFRLPGVPDAGCHCTDCESALSPAAYLTDLLDYAVRNVARNTTTSITLDDLQSLLHQPLADLPTACGEIEAPIRQVRLAIEVLRSFLASNPPPSALADLLAIHEKAYCLSTYTSLLQAAGTSYTALRVALGDPARAAALADRLGIDAEDLGGLLLAPEQMTEAAIEMLFGLVDTTRDPFSNGGIVSGPTGVLRRFELDNVLWGRDTDAQGLIYARVKMNGLSYEIALYRDSARTEQVAHGIAGGPSPAPFVFFDGGLNSDFSGSATLVATLPTTPTDLVLSAIPRLLAFQYKHLRTLWAFEDFPSTALPDAPPLIDPDLLSVADFRAVLAGDPALDLWTARYGQSLGRLLTLATGRPSAPADIVVWLDAKLLGTLGVASATLVQWGHDAEQGADISAELATAGLLLDELDYLLEVRDFVARPVPAPVTNDEWFRVASILWQVERRKLYPAWRAEEKAAGLTLSADHFRVPADDDLTLDVDAWQANVEQREAWKDTLIERSAAEDALRAALDAQIATVEEALLPSLRDDLIQATPPFAPSTSSTRIQVQADELGKRLFLDFRATSRELSTRVTAAIEALQGLVLAGRTGALTAVYPDLSFAAPQFIDGWRWLGSYATWRAAMGVLLYPENTLLPTLRPAHTQAFATFLDTLRSGPPLRPEQACELGCTYYDYLRDITSLTVQASCVTRANVRSDAGSCCGIAGSAELFFFFAQGAATKKIYWSAMPVGFLGQMDSGDQTLWGEVPGAGPEATVIGAVPYGPTSDERRILVFLRAHRAGSDRLYVTRYDLETLSWDDQPTELTAPENAEQFDVVVEQRNEFSVRPEQWEKDPPFVVFLLPDNRVFLNWFDVDRDDWRMGGPWLLAKQAAVPPNSGGNIGGPTDADAIDGLCALVRMDNRMILFASGAATTGVRSVFWTANYTTPWPPAGPQPIMRWNNIRAEGGTWGGCFLYAPTPEIYAFVNQGANTYYHEISSANSAFEGVIASSIRLAIHSGQEEITASLLARISFQTSGVAGGPFAETVIKDNTGKLGEFFPCTLAPTASAPPAVVAELSDADLAQRRQALQVLFQQNQGDTTPYLAYFSEAYLDFPVQIALELERGGYYEDALDWLRTVYNIGAQGENRKIYYGLTLEETLGSAFTRASNWLLDSLNPHTIASQRSNIYTRSVLLTIASCLVAYADSELARGSLESVARARELYGTARTVLYSNDLQQNRPQCADAIGSIDFPVGEVDIATTTRALRTELGTIEDAASLNAAVEAVTTALAAKGDVRANLALSRVAVAKARAAQPKAPRLGEIVSGRTSYATSVRSFLIARPEVEQTVSLVGAAAAQVLGPARLAIAGLNDAMVPEALYTFCVPPNPVLLALQKHADLALDKIRNGRDLAGELRRPNPDDALGGLLVPASTAVSLDPTPYRYETLVDRARQLVSISQQVESSMLTALERRDAEAYSALKARQDLQLASAGVRLQDLDAIAAEDDVGLAILQRSRAQLAVDHYQQLIDQGPSLLQEVGAGLQIASVVAMSVAVPGLVDAATAVGATLAQQLAASQGTAQALGGGASLLATFSSFDRQQDDWAFQRDLAQADVGIATQQINIASDKVDIAQQQLLIATTQTAQDQAVVEFLANKFTGVELYEWMSDVLAGVYRYFLQQATAIARLASDQLSFERQEAIPPFIRSDYWIPPADTTAKAPTDTSGLTGSVRLLQDLTQLDQYAFATDQRKLQLTKTISLAHVAPIELENLRRTGLLAFATPMELFDRDFPGHYLRLIHRVRTSIIALIPPDQGICATLANNGVSRVVVGPTFSSAIVRRPPSSVAITTPINSTGLFDQDTQPELLLPFEGLGVDTAWELSLPLASNQFDFRTISDVVVTIDYTALDSAPYRARVLKSLGDVYRAERPVSLRDEFADAWFELNNPCATMTDLEASFTLGPNDFAPNVHDVTIEHLTLYFARAPGESFEVPITKIELAPADGTPVRSVGPAVSKNGVISTRMPDYAGWICPASAPQGPNCLAGKPYGKWTLHLPSTDDLRKELACDTLRDILVVITYRASTTIGPRDTVPCNCSAATPPPPAGG